MNVHYEIERKYSLPVRQKQEAVHFCTMLANGQLPKQFSLVDFRYNYTNDSDQRKFDRVRIMLEALSGQRTYLWTRKTTLPDGTKSEEEQFISEEEARSKVCDTSGKIIIKERIEWHVNLDTDSIKIPGLTVAIDTVSHIHDTCFWELEVLRNSTDDIERLLNLFDEIVAGSNIDAHTTDLTTNKASRAFTCDNLDNLLVFSR